MDINSNMNLENLENLEKIIGVISEVEIEDIDVSLINEEMVLHAIERNIDNNRILNRNVNIAICDLVRNDLIENSVENTRKR